MARDASETSRQRTVKAEYERRLAKLAKVHRQDQNLTRQPDGTPTQQRTVEQQEKLDNKTQMQRREVGLESNKSRSASRRDRRRRVKQEMDDGTYMMTGTLEALEEADAQGDLKAMQPFDRIGPDKTSMNGPVTHSRAMRGEIPIRGSDPRQPYYIQPEEEDSSDLKDTDGLKLTLEANLDIEIELKASIRGDITLSLFA